MGNATPPGRTVSTSRQFIVYGPDVRLRGAVAEVAEQIKKTALHLLQERDDWKTPIVINAQYPEANLPELPAARLDLSQTGFGLKLQLELRFGMDVEGLAVERELLRAIYLEMMYRAAPDTAAGTMYVQPPDWLLEGTLALGATLDPAALAEKLGTAIGSGKIISLGDFLQQQPSLLESPSRALYRAYAAALISMLSEGPDGHRRLARFVADLPRASNDPLAELTQHFPALADDPDKREMAWAFNVARFAASERYRMLNCEETERQLAQLLQLEIRDRAQATAIYTLEEFPRFVSEPNANVALQGLTQRLLLFSGRANPLFRPVIAEYQKIIVLLVRGKKKHLTERLAELRAMREQISRRMSAIGDYINWFEATQARSASGAFRDYLKAAELTQEREPRRHDRISIYLDALEAQAGY